MRKILLLVPSLYKLRARDPVPRAARRSLNLELLLRAFYEVVAGDAVAGACVGGVYGFELLLIVIVIVIVVIVVAVVVVIAVAAIVIVIVVVIVFLAKCSVGEGRRLAVEDLARDNRVLDTLGVRELVAADTALRDTGDSVRLDIDVSMNLGVGINVGVCGARRAAGESVAGAGKLGVAEVASFECPDNGAGDAAWEQGVAVAAGHGRGEVGVDVAPEAGERDGSGSREAEQA